MRNWILALIFTFSWLTSYAQKIPIVVESQKLTYDDKKKIAIYTGSVIAQRGKTVMKGDKMVVYFDKSGKYVEKIEAVRNVEITDPQGKGWCDRLFYYPAQEKVILVGNAKLVQGKNVVVGDKIIAYNDGRVWVEGVEKKVKTVFYPEESNATGKGIKLPSSGGNN